MFAFRLAGFFFDLIFKTALPLATIGSLIGASKLLRLTYKGHAKDYDEKPFGAFLADICGNLWFYFLFLVYPSTCATIFKAFVRSAP